MSQINQQIRKYISHSGVTIEKGDFYGGGIEEVVSTLEEMTVLLQETIQYVPSPIQFPITITPATPWTPAPYPAYPYTVTGQQNQQM